MSFLRVFILILIYSSEINGQSTVSSYRVLTKRADSLYNLRLYKESAILYSEAFRRNKSNSLIEDYYRAACSWALANYTDSSFINLENIISKYSDYKFISEDSDLVSLHNDIRWPKLISRVKTNEEKNELLRKRVKDSLIVCDTLTSINIALYRKLQGYRCISIGEMHGTKEPVSFLTGLVKSFTLNKKNVLIGFEVSKSAMFEFLENKNDSVLLNTTFFKKGFGDGRNSQAWLNAIAYFNKLGVKFCFFDDVNSYEKFVNILNCYRLDTNSVILTISGNIHNMKVPYGKSKTMGCYLKDYFGKEMLSVGHIFKQGTMYNRTSEGLKTHRVEKKESFFSTVTSHPNYFFINFKESNLINYDAYLFTTYITASLPTNHN